MKKFMKKLLKKTEGFTLVELIVVIAILGILAAIGTVAYSGYIKEANNTAVLGELEAIEVAAQAAASMDGDVVAGITVGKDGKVTIDLTAGTDLTSATAPAYIADFYTVNESHLASLIAKHNDFKDAGAKWAQSTDWVKQ